MLGEMGQQVLWRPATLCPCQAEYSSSPDVNCPNCHGRGVVWGKAIPAHTGTAGQSTSRKYASYGRFEDGDVVWTIPSNSPMWDCGEFDRVIMTQSSLPFSRNLTRDGTEKVSLSVISVDRCVWRRPGDNLLIDAGLPRIDPDTNEVSWVDQGSAPDPGAQYSISGRYRPEYFIFGSLPRDRAHYQGLDRPRLVIARKFELFQK